MYQQKAFVDNISTMLCEKGHNAFAKSFFPCQPVQSPQTDRPIHFAIFKVSVCQRTIIPHDTYRMS